MTQRSPSRSVCRAEVGAGLFPGTHRLLIVGFAITRILASPARCHLAPLTSLRCGAFSCALCAGDVAISRGRDFIDAVRPYPALCNQLGIVSVGCIAARLAARLGVQSVGLPPMP